MSNLKLLSHAVLPSLPHADVTIYADHRLRDTDYYVIFRLGDNSPALQNDLQRTAVFPLGLHRVCLTVLAGIEEPLPSDKIMQFVAQQRESQQSPRRM
jgi:hypothetical protein